MRLPAGTSVVAGCSPCLLLRGRGAGGRDCHLLCMRDDVADCLVCLIRRGTNPDIQAAKGMMRAALGHPAADS